MSICTDDIVIHNKVSKIRKQKNMLQRKNTMTKVCSVMKFVNEHSSRFGQINHDSVVDALCSAQRRVSISVSRLCCCSVCRWTAVQVWFRLCNSLPNFGSEGCNARLQDLHKWTTIFCLTPQPSAEIYHHCSKRGWVLHMLALDNIDRCLQQRRLVDGEQHFEERNHWNMLCRVGK